MLRRLLAHETLRFATLLGVAALLSDWTTKSWAMASIGAGPVWIAEGVLLGVVHNDALAFSTATALPLASVISLRLTCLAVVIVLCQHFAPSSRRLAAGFALVIAGGLGNAADLFFRDGAVVDFIGAGPFAVAGEPFAIVFNLADVWILGGIVLLFPLIRAAGQHAQTASEALERRLFVRAG